MRNCARAGSYGGNSTLVFGRNSSGISSPSYLGAGQSVTTGFLERLARGLGASLGPEMLPPNILSRTPELIVWWSPEKHRLLFFGDGNKDTTELNGRMYPHPA